MSDHQCRYLRYMPGANQPWYGLDDIGSVRRSIKKSSDVRGYKLFSLDAYGSYVPVPRDLWLDLHWVDEDAS